MLMLIHGNPGGHGQPHEEGTDEPAGHALGTVDTRQPCFSGFRLPVLRLAGGVLDEARKRFGCGCEVAVVGFAFIFDLLVVVSLVAEPWTRASFASPTFACLCSGLLVVF